MESYHFFLIISVLAIALSLKTFKKRHYLILAISSIFTYMNAEFVNNNYQESVFVSPYSFLILCIYYRILSKEKINIAILTITTYLSIYIVDVIYAFKVDDFSGIGGLGYMDGLVIMPLICVLGEYLLRIWDQKIKEYNNNKKEKV